MTTQRIPTFNVTAINALRDRLIERVFIPRMNESPQGEHLTYLVQDLCATLPPGILRDAVYETARQLLDVELTPAVYQRFAWRLAGNLPTLRAGRPVLPWTVQIENEWVPVQIIKADLDKNRRDELGHTMYMRILAGTPTGMVTSRFFTRRFAFALARRLGFSKRNGHFPYTDPSQLVNLRLTAEIDAAKSTTEPRFSQMLGTPAVIDANRELLRLRLHLDPCPNGWRHPCHNCVVGYLTCPAATHRQDYVKAMCHSCSTEAYFDPDSTSGKCVACERRDVIKR